MNTCNEIGEQFRAEDLDSLLENGHELGSHTFSHVSCRAVACAEFREDVKRGSKAIEEMTGQDSPNFAYPFGHITLPAKRSLGQGIASLRSIFPGFNGPEVDLNLLRANSLYGDFNDHEWADELIRENVERNSWLIFYTHDVDSQPSAYGCTPELLEAAVSCALDCGCRILTVREALAESGVQNGNPKGHAPCAVSV
jgi:peptidoglycan/xylan/chitin deacetylase (PgdA/CDA1 family)